MRRIHVGLHVTSQVYEVKIDIELYVKILVSLFNMKLHENTFSLSHCSEVLLQGGLQYYFVDAILILDFQ